MDGRNSKGQFVKGRKGALEDLAGVRFERLKAIEYAGNGKWLCECECGKKKKISARCLKNGTTKSCGCLHDEAAKINSTTHGKSKTKIYGVYRTMISRCYCETNEKYPIYGARGIKVCQEWLDNFMNFYNWSMENGYQDGLTIDRIDVNGNYEPSNCRWITQKEQQNNRRSNHFVEINGETKTLSEWVESRIYEADKATVYKRLSRGWSDIDAITKPVIRKFRNKRFD